MSDSFAPDVATARAHASVLDNPEDLDNAAILGWMKRHVAFRRHGRSYVLGTEILPPRWRAEAVRISSPHDGIAFLLPLAADHTAMRALRRTVERLLGQCLVANDSAVLETLAQALVTGRIWLIKDAHKPPVAGETSAAVGAKLNGELGTRVDFHRLSRWEGGQYLRGYVPFYKGVTAGASGMTIATAFDLGQKDAGEMSALGLPDTVTAKIAPFVDVKFKGMTRSEVAARVSKLGPVPTLTQEEADAVDAAVFGQHLRAAIASWNTRRKPGAPEFKALPGAWQTVLFSRTFHQGVGMPNAAVAKPFYGAATEGRWADAIKLLRDYSVGAAWYKQRVGEEAALLQTDIPPAVVTPAAPPPLPLGQRP